MSERDLKRTCRTVFASPGPAGRFARMSLVFPYLSITITALALSHPQLRAQQMTNQAPPPGAPSSATADGPEDPADASEYPTAHRVSDASAADQVTFTSSGPQSFSHGVYLLVGDVVITSGARTVRADRIEYDSNSGDLTASGHLVIEDDGNQEHLTASHGTYNLTSATGRFYNV
jgi:LPS-assembly protein